jgi:hypothetical protein
MEQPFSGVCGWTVRVGDSMHFSATQYRHYAKSYRSFREFILEVLAARKREVAALEALRQGKRGPGFGIGASPLRQTSAPLPAWG